MLYFEVIGSNERNMLILILFYISPILIWLQFELYDRYNEVRFLISFHFNRHTINHIIDKRRFLVEYVSIK